MSSASASGSSSGLSQTPTSRCDASSVRSAFHSATGTMIGIPAGRAARDAGSRSRVQRSSTIAPSLMSRGIHALLEWLQSQAPHGVDEVLVLVPALDVDFDEPRHHVRHLLRGERRADDLAERRAFSLRTANRNLVPLLAILVDAEHTDVANVMMSAGIHAPGHVERYLADVVQVVEVVEAPLDRFRDRDRLGVGERAEISAGAADDVCQQSDVRRGEPEAFQLGPQSEKLRLLHIGEHQILFVANAQLAEAVTVGERSDRVHL